MVSLTRKRDISSLNVNEKGPPAVDGSGCLSQRGCLPGPAWPCLCGESRDPRRQKPNRGSLAEASPCCPHGCRPPVPFVPSRCCRESKSPFIGTKTPKTNEKLPRQRARNPRGMCSAKSHSSSRQPGFKIRTSRDLDSFP